MQNDNINNGIKEKISIPESQNNEKESIKLGLESENVVEKSTEAYSVNRKITTLAEDRATNEKSGSGIVSTTNSQAYLSEREKKIEKIMEKDLSDVYLGLSLEKKREFKAAGEKATKEINTLLSSSKVKLKKIINIIKNWLSIIPGVNKFFLEKMAKIKSDEIVKIKNNDGQI